MKEEGILPSSFLFCKLHLHLLRKDRRMRLSILYKIIGVLIISISVTGIAIFFTARHFMTEGFEKVTSNNLIIMEKIVATEISNLHKKYLDDVRDIAKRPNLIEALAEHNVESMLDILTKEMHRTKSQFITLADPEGNAILRTHSKKRGDSILNQDVVRRALRGESSVNIEHGTAV